MIILLLSLLITLLMLTTSKKPYNPNYDASTAEDINWNTTDLLSFLDNIHNVPLNDITTTGKDIQFYQTATKAETAAELIRTVNFTHYKLLSAVKAVIDLNNTLLNKTKTLNNSFDSYEKKLNKLATQTQRNNILLLQMKMAHLRPEPPIKDLKNDIYQSIRIDPNVDESTYQIINGSPTNTPVILREPQLNTNISDTNISDTNISEPRLDTIVDELTPTIINDSVINPTTNHSDDSSTPRIDTIIAEPSPPTINGSPEQTIQLQNTQSFCGPTISSAIMRGQIILLNEPQLNHDAKNITASPTTVTFDKTIQAKKTVKSPQIKSKIKKIKPKIKMKKKKKKFKNNNKRINKKKIKRQKQKKMNIIVKNNISNVKLEQIIKTYFTDEDYQEWMNIRLYDNDYTAALHYEKTYGILAINTIKQAHANDQ